jgi:hypothetical protein
MCKAIAMRIELRIDGGLAHFPGLAKPLVVDSKQLAEDDKAQAINLCHAALDARSHAADPPSAPAPAPTADARRYRLKIELDGSTHELATTDPISNPAIAQLIAFLEDRRPA